MMDGVFSGAGFRFAEPWWLMLLPAVAAWWWIAARRRKRGGMMFPGLAGLREAGFGASSLWAGLPRLLLRAAMVLALLSLARPQMTREVRPGEREGVDIMLVLDISDSMAEEDFGGRTRLEAARDLARRFVEGRPADRFGLVLFRGKSFTQCPLTADHRVLLTLLGAASPEAISDEGTAIGSAILVATNRLKASASGERLMVLLTDGEQNAGGVGPATAAQLAANEGVRIYTIGVARDGSPGRGRAVSPEREAFNEAALREVARVSGGRFFMASDRGALGEAFSEIDAIERSRFDGPATTERAELYAWFLLPSLGLLAAGLVLGNTRLMRIPS
ncbi:hypothetical protein CHL67_10985 [Prosthecochloris sp. GSB1]|uniref:vWA domain-containing protein n=1 Tax=Prosthecochloris sp. GSB1 TaxID=281093 RepID=UPI000B8C7C6F|nr:VWA domain-containing protein [Prosthecochloris sp. GSB1]ASQ91372.1 hypothetical protein CHL67_10985 [Prosthecochloris sp. GSB1]